MELRKAPVGLQFQMRAIRCESATGNKSKCRTDLSAYQTLEMELYVHLYHGHGVSISNIESSISGVLPFQSLNETLSIEVVYTIWSGDPDALQEILNMQARSRSRSRLAVRASGLVELDLNVVTAQFDNHYDVPRARHPKQTIQTGSYSRQQE